jgi:ABC-2 type transport system permease protein
MMWTIAKRELRMYFGQLTAYLVVGGYLLLTTLGLWFFDTPFNLMNSELGSFTPFFELSPLLFLFLLPALAMRSFSEEFSLGTFELLMTKPIKLYVLFAGKLLGIFLIFISALLPTLLHAYFLEQLLQANDHLDWGVILSSYGALLLLGLLFSVSSMCASLLFQSQVAAFLAGLFLCFSQFYMWSYLAEGINDLFWYQWINNLGASLHYYGLSRGVLSFDDLAYFIGFIAFFFHIGIILIQKKRQ